jgi:hypothetical protein
MRRRVTGSQEKVMWRQSQIVVAALLSLAGCAERALEPNVDCTEAVGQVFIELQPKPTGFGYEVPAGSSIQITASLRRTTRAEPVFRSDQGWTCNVTSTSPVPGTVSFTTDDTHIVSLSDAVWIRGLSRGLAIVTASSQQAASPVTFGVVVN